MKRNRKGGSSAPGRGFSGGNANNNQKNIVITITIVLGLVLLILISVLKHKLIKIPLIDKLLNITNIGVDSIKDALQVVNLNPKLQRKDNKMFELSWNPDGSDSYSVLFSRKILNKFDFIGIDKYTEAEMDAHGIYFVDLRLNKPSPKNKGTSMSNNSIVKITGHFYHKVKFSLDIEDKNELFCLEVKSSHGRISNVINHVYVVGAGENNIVNANNNNKYNDNTENKYHTLTTTPVSTTNTTLNHKSDSNISTDSNSHLSNIDDNIKIFIEGSNKTYKLYINEPTSKSSNHVFTGDDSIFLNPTIGGIINEYKLYLYYDKNHSSIIDIPKTEKERYSNNGFSTVVTFNIEGPCLCHIKGFRSVGENFTRFLSWLNEDKAFKIEGLSDYINTS